MNIAIVRLSALGDIVNTAFVLQFIKLFHPSAKITWITEEVFAPIFTNHPHIDQVVTVNLKTIKKKRSLPLLIATIRKLRSLPEFDLVIDMQGLIKSALVSRVISPNTHGFDKNSIREPFASNFYKTTSSIPYETNVVLRNAKVVSDPLGFIITEKMIQNKEAVFPITKTFTLETIRPNVAFVIGASWESKKYPKERIVDVLMQLEINAHIIWGNQQEKEEAEYIVSKTKNASLAPQMQLPELVSFISHCDLVVGNDTGPTHIGWAQNVPSITLFGPTNERMIFQTEKNIAIHSDSPVDINKINKNDYSITKIDPKIVIEKIKGLLYGL